MQHPGIIIRERLVGLSVTDAAKLLGVERHTLSNLLNGHSGISPAMALRLERTGYGTAKEWVIMQAEYDLAEEREKQAA